MCSTEDRWNPLERPVLQPFTDLGHVIADVWRRRNFHGGDFPRIARQCLEEFNPPALDLEPLLNDMATRPVTPPLHLFSDLSIRLFEANDFYLEVLVWLDGHNLIHEHAFSGAFRVLQGGSLHNTYRFHSDQTLTRGFRVGRLESDHAEFLTEGDVREIRPGPESLHSLIHLERPSMTLVARTHSEPWSLPQLQIERPYFAMDSDLPGDDRVRFCTRSVDTLRRLDEFRGQTLLMRYLSWLDFPRAFALCSNLSHWATLGSGPAFDLLAERFGALGQLVPEVLRVRRRLDNLVNLRKRATDPDDRLILGMASTVLRREQIHALTAQRFGAVAANKRLESAHSNGWFDLIS